MRGFCAILVEKNLWAAGVSTLEPTADFEKATIYRSSWAATTAQVTAVHLGYPDAEIVRLLIAVDRDEPGPLLQATRTEGHDGPRLAENRRSPTRSAEERRAQ